MKILQIVFASVLLLLFVSPLAMAVETEDYYNAQLEASGAGTLVDEVPDSVREQMGELGIDKLDFSSLFNSSPRKLVELFFEIIRNEYVSPFKTLFAIMSTLILLSVADIFGISSGNNSRAFEVIGSVIMAISILIPLAGCIDRVCAAISVCSNFMLAFIPVFAGVITAGGNPMLAVSYNSFVFFAAQGVVGISESAIKPLTQITLAFGMLSSTVTAVNFSSIIEFIKKITMFLMSIASTMFITILTLNGLLANSADSLSVRGIRFLIGNLVPVVGRAISDGYTSIISGITLIKNTIGTFAIVAVALIILPCVIECICWTLCLFIGSSLADILGLEKQSELIKAMSASVVMLCATAVFASLLMIISTAILLILKGAA